jgi:hypothetical protein
VAHFNSFRSRSQSRNIFCWIAAALAVMSAATVTAHGMARPTASARAGLGTVERIVIAAAAVSAFATLAFVVGLATIVLAS